MRQLVHLILKFWYVRVKRRPYFTREELADLVVRTWVHLDLSKRDTREHTALRVLIVHNSISDISEMIKYGVLVARDDSRFSAPRKEKGAAEERLREIAQDSVLDCATIYWGRDMVYSGKTPWHYNESEREIDHVFFRADIEEVPLYLGDDAAGRLIAEWRLAIGK